MPVHISPHFTEEKLDRPSLNDLIDVFEDRVKYWVFEPARQLLSQEHTQIAAFSLLLTYFEGIWIYIRGEDSRNKSPQFFREAFIDVFRSSGLNDSLLGRVADVLYQDARCGFFHDGMFRERIYFKKLTQGDLIITLPKKNGQIDETGRIQSILIDPSRFFDAINRHFIGLVAVLRDPTQKKQRTTFERICNEKWNWQKQGPIIGLPDPTIQAT